MSEEKTTTERERIDEASDHEQDRHRVKEKYSEERTDKSQREENIRIKESLSKRILREVSSSRPLMIKMEKGEKKENYIKHKRTTKRQANIRVRNSLIKKKKQKTTMSKG